MVLSQTVLSQTLKSITVTKIRELQKQLQTYNARKSKILASTENHHDLRDRVSALYNHLVDLKLWDDPEFENVRRWIRQSQFDPSFSPNKLVACEEQLLNRLNIESRKLDLADLYSRLLTEWIEKNRAQDTDTDKSAELADETDSFEVIESMQREQLDQLREKFAKVIFEPLQTDETEIDLYLKSLFEGEQRQPALKDLRTSVKSKTKSLDLLTIDRQSLLWTIKALQKNGLLNDEKKAILQEFAQDEAVLNEIQGVLNMRLKDIATWSWDLGEDGMPVVPRRSANGKWRVMVDDDVMQALLTHFIGTYWATHIKSAMQSVIMYTNIWKHHGAESEDDRKKRLYFAPRFNDSRSKGIESLRQENYREDFFLAPIPSKQFEEAGGYDDDDETLTDKKSGKDIKQMLLRTLTTEILLRRTFDGEVAVVQSDFQWFATGIPHSTIFATLRFIGFDADAMSFVQKVLEPPLDMLDGEPVRTRKRGLPMAHIFEKLFGEVVLFFMDIAVNLDASQILYRFHDDLWLVGKPAQCAQAWTSMEHFAKVMGLEFNHNKTGSVYLTKNGADRDPKIVAALPEGPVTMYLLVLDPQTGDWTINQDQVDQHVQRLQKQLNETGSVLEWIKTWNSCVGRFFGYTFGEPAHCFGKSHVDAVLATHQKMQQYLFDGQNGNGDSVSAHVKQMISSRFSVPVESIADAFLYLPDILGGLGLKNPFIELFLARRSLTDDPVNRLQRLLKDEQREYKNRKSQFEHLSDRERRKRWKKEFVDDDDAEANPPVLRWEDAQVFPSLDAFFRYREDNSTALRSLYNHLMSAPHGDDISMTEGVETSWDHVEKNARPKSEGGSEMPDLTENHELLWLLEYYRDDLQKDFGGLLCAPTELLPLGVLGVMRKKKVTWQMVL